VPHLIEVAFRGNRKEFFLWEHEDSPPIKAAVIVDADRGEDLGHVHATGELADKRAAGVPHGLAAGAPTRHVLRLATLEDEARAAELAEQNEVARQRAVERVKANGLVMKLTDAEWQWDRRKLTFYFTAEKRVDFRQLVRELAAMFRTRIELKQIGVRDEAKRLDGIGRCGRQYCSASWLPELRPVNLGVAKDQRLSLNPSQISGACGRLMCCLRYEHEFYVQSRKRFPKEGKILVTARGEEKVVANDIFGDRVTLRNVEGDTRVVPLVDLRRELAEGVEPGADEADAVDAVHGPRALAGQLGIAADGGRASPSRAAAPVREHGLGSTSRTLPIAASLPARPPAATAPSELVRSPVPPTSEPGEQDDEEGGDEGADGAGAGGPADPEAAERRARRRRGRRGGRRGKGGGASQPPPPGD
jgi:cell fate regulator YaaT (PSP1 superfamily)